MLYHLQIRINLILTACSILIRVIGYGLSTLKVEMTFSLKNKFLKWIALFLLDSVVTFYCNILVLIWSHTAESNNNQETCKN